MPNIHDKAYAMNTLSPMNVGGRWSCACFSLFGGTRSRWAMGLYSCRPSILHSGSSCHVTVSRSLEESSKKMSCGTTTCFHSAIPNYVPATLGSQRQVARDVVHGGALGVLEILFGHYRDCQRLQRFLESPYLKDFSFWRSW